MFRKLTSLTKYKAHTTTILFILGFVFDIVMLPSIDHPITRYIGLAHIFIVAFLIMFREWVISRNTASSTEQKMYSFASFGIAFSSGAALSFIFVYAMRSAAFLVSWPLLVLLFLCILANELVATHDFRFTLDVGVLLVAVLFFIIFNMPIMLAKQNDWVFTLSVGVSMVISLLYLFLLQFTSESAKYEAPRTYALAVGIPMFVFMLYFLNVIPAVPLSLKEAGVYHSIIHTESGEYLAQTETDTRLLKKYRANVYHISPTDQGVYFFSNIDTPAALTAPVSHVWEQYNGEANRWESRAEISFDIKGGREEGYRAYSYKENVEEGLWRVTVKIGNNRIIGREKFKILKVNEGVEMKQVSL
jgi:hypothetical protein